MDNQTKQCKHCKKDIHQDAKRCSHCQGDLRSWFLRHKVLTGIAIFVTLFIILASFGSSEEVQQKVAEQEIKEAKERNVDIKVSAIDLTREYKDNGVSADIKYKGKVVEISGVISNIDKDILDDPYVILGGSQTSLFGIQCMFPRSSEGELANLSKGQLVTLKGEVSSDFIINVLIRGCSIVK